MRYLLIALSILMFQVTPARADVSVSIGINVATYPELVPVPGYPVYYDPNASSNYFFYDGLYWVYMDDNWYSSSWYNGPWVFTEPVYVPVYVLRVPVRYYRRPPLYFHGWIADAPPRWGQHWGPSWEARRRGWDQWNHRSVPRAAPLPVYQRQYSGDRYPHEAAQQHVIRNENYRYQPHERLSRKEVQQQDRLRPQPQAQPARAEPEYYRGGQANKTDSQENTPGHRAPDGAVPANPGQGTPRQGNAGQGNTQQTPINTDNRFESGRGRDNRRPSQPDSGQNSRAASQIPLSQHNHFESGGSPGDRYGPNDTGGDNRGGDNRGGDGNGGQGRGQGGHGQDRR